MNERIEAIYNKIANKANEMIPVKWSKILLNAEIEPGVMTIHYVFYDEQNTELILFDDIPDRYNVDEDIYYNYRNELNDLINELNNETINENGERWSIVTFILNADGKFSIDYSYENLDETDEMIRRERFEEKYLK